MLEAFFADLERVHWLLAYSVKGILIGILVTIALFAISIPAHIISSALRGPLEASAARLDAISQFFWQQTVRLVSLSRAVVDDFVEITKLHLVFDHHEEKIFSTITSIKEVVTRIPEKINTRSIEIEASVNKLNEHIKEISEKDIQGVAAKIPDLELLQYDEAIYRRAVWKIFFGAIFAPALILINTFIINEFFKGFVTIYIYDIPVATILSGIFSLIEVGLGVVIYIQQQKPQNNTIRRVSAEYILIGCVIGLAAIEGFFYAILSLQIDPEILNALFEPESTPYWAKLWLVPFGPTIVIVLSFIGHTFVEAWDERRHGALAKALRADLLAIRTAGAKLISDFEVAKGHAKELVNHGKDFRKDFVGAKGQMPTLAEDIEKNRASLQQAAEEIAILRREPYKEFDRGECLRIFYVQLGFTAVTALVISLFVFIQFIFWRHHPKLPQADQLPFIIALVEAGIVLGASYFLAQTIRLIIEGEIARVVASPTDWLKVAASWAAIIAVIAFNWFLIIYDNTFSEWLWFSLAVASIAGMVFMGRNLGLMISALWTGAKAIFLGLASGFSWALGACAALAREICRALKHFLAAFGYPFTILWNWFSNKKVGAAA